MRLSSLELAQFRNYRALTMQPGRRINLLLGANAQGKTNLLEAVALLMRGRSRRVRTRSDIVTHGEKECRIAARFSDDQEVAHDVTLTIDRAGVRRMTLDRQKLERTSLLYEKLPCVLLESGDLEMLFGAPALRRSFLDMLCLEISTPYIAVYARYQRLLRSRNILLAKLQASSSQFKIITTQTAAAAAPLAKARLATLENLREAVGKLPAKEVGEELSLHYVLTGGDAKTAANLTEEALAGWYQTALCARLEEDRRMKTTTLGPHRDDLGIRLGNRAIKNVASRGQLKDALLRLKLAEAAAIQRRRGEPPVLLLDDAFSETDDERRRHMIGWLPRDTQIFLTGTDRQLAKDLGDRECRRFRVRKGEVEAGSSD